MRVSSGKKALTDSQGDEFSISFLDHIRLALCQGSAGRRASRQGSALEANNPWQQPADSRGAATLYRCHLGFVVRTTIPRCASPILARHFAVCCQRTKLREAQAFEQSLRFSTARFWKASRRPWYLSVLTGGFFTP